MCFCIAAVHHFLPYAKDKDTWGAGAPLKSSARSLPHYKPCWTCRRPRSMQRKTGRSRVRVAASRVVHSFRKRPWLVLNLQGLYSRTSYDTSWASDSKPTIYRNLYENMGPGELLSRHPPERWRDVSLVITRWYRLYFVFYHRKNTSF